MNLKTKVKFAVYAISTVSMATIAVNPAISGMCKEFPTIPSSVIQLVITLPSAFIVLFVIFGSRITMLLSKKTLLLIGDLLIAFGGMMPALMNDFYVILVLRCILGIGVGIVVPVSTSVLTDYLENAERDSAMGMQSAVVCAGGILYGLFGAFLVDFGWRYTFLAYATCIPIFFILLLLPKQKVTANIQKTKIRLNKQVILISFLCFLITASRYILTVGIPFFLDEESLANPSVNGIITTINMFGGLIAGLLYGSFAKALKKHTLLAGILGTSIGMLITYFANDISVVFVGTFIHGITMSLIFPRLNIMVSKAAEPYMIPIALSVLFATNNLGQFFGPIMFSSIGNMLGNGTTRFEFLLAAVLMLVVGLIIYLTNRADDKAVKMRN